MRENSEINFPPFTVKNGIMVFFKKVRYKFKVYILHPELGFRKLTTNIADFLRNDAFIALTNNVSETILYLNGDMVRKVNKEDLAEELEIGDYVMVEVKNDELENIDIGEGVHASFPAKIKKIKTETVQFEFFSVGAKIIIAELPISRIKK